MYTIKYFNRVNLIFDLVENLKWKWKLHFVYNLFLLIVNLYIYYYVNHKLGKHIIVSFNSFQRCYIEFQIDKVKAVKIVNISFLLLRYYKIFNYAIPYVRNIKLIKTILRFRNINLEMIARKASYFIHFYYTKNVVSSWHTLIKAPSRIIIFINHINVHFILW